MNRCMDRFILRRLCLVTMVLFLTGLACSVLGGQQGPSAIEQTANALSTSVVLTQTAVAIPATVTPSNTPKPTETTRPTKTATLTDTPEPSLTTKPITHKSIPGEPGDVKTSISDVSCAPYGDQQFAPAGDDYTMNLFERPFTDKMLYRPDIDIQKAEISSNGPFAIVSIYLQGTNPDGNALKANYGVEIDTNLDGRGEYLVWILPPTGTDWSTDGVSVYADNNKDVGGTTPMVSDAPNASGDGYETVIFPTSDNSNPDGAWSRISPTDPKVVQIAFMPSLFDKKQFIWWVWADDGLKNPALFDYNDRFTLGDAGSPLKNSDAYPLKKLYSVDNTCRTGLDLKLTGKEPGICGSSKSNSYPTVTLPVSTKLLPTRVQTMIIRYTKIP